MITVLTCLTHSFHAFPCRILLSKLGRVEGKHDQELDQHGVACEKGEKLGIHPHVRGAACSVRSWVHRSLRCSPVKNAATVETPSIWVGGLL